MPKKKWQIEDTNMKKVGVLALQGAFKEHVEIINTLGHMGIEVRNKQQLEDVDGIILPGGESTAIGKLLLDLDIKELLVEKINKGLPVWGTCAGMILLAKEVEGNNRPHLAVMDIKVKRNAYGTQLDSFRTTAVIKAISEKEIPMVFIRAPYIVDCDEKVEVLHKVEGEVVAARQRNMLATSFHPELTSDTTFHEYFIGMI